MILLGDDYFIGVSHAHDHFGDDMVMIFIPAIQESVQKSPAEVPGVQDEVLEP